MLSPWPHRKPCNFPGAAILLDTGDGAAEEGDAEQRKHNASGRGFPERPAAQMHDRTLWRRMVPMMRADETARLVAADVGEQEVTAGWVSERAAPGAGRSHGWMRSTR